MTVRRQPAGGVISLLTDFGIKDPFVGVMKGVIATLHRPALVIDLTHDIPPQDVAAGAFVLARSYRYFPRGTVHLAIVDPGVGTKRKPIAIEFDGHYFVGPDNGVLSLAAPRGRCVILDRTELFLSPVSATFHGRDVFAPVAARLCAGMPLSCVGSSLALSERIRIRPPRVRISGGAVRGRVLSCDRFGNLITNIEPKHVFRSEAPSDSARRGIVEVAGQSIHGIRSSYGAAAEGELVAVFGGYGLLEIAVRNGSAQSTLRVQAGARVTLCLP